jgi:hypothetical protein
MDEFIDWDEYRRLRAEYLKNNKIVSDKLIRPKAGVASSAYYTDVAAKQRQLLQAQQHSRVARDAWREELERPYDNTISFAKNLARRGRLRFAAGMARNRAREVEREYYILVEMPAIVGNPGQPALPAAQAPTMEEALRGSLYGFARTRG